MRILKESYQDVETYLRGAELVDDIINKFGKRFAVELEPGEVADYVSETVNEMFDTEQVGKESVTVFKVNGDDANIISTDHIVVTYNGTYYDYCAMRFNESFNGLINLSAIPVVQNVVHSNKQITDRLSTVKGYVLLGE